ncbi:MAG: sugar phosphate isomerase/epimerase [Acidobacteria bacterium]|nr:sugar phosphate isomerase/epimerase [Acidobacteriota bacterium]
MFWAGRDPLETVREVKSLGARSGQLGVPGDLDLAGAAAGWRAAIEAEGFALVTVFAAYVGEDYADIPTVERTVGFIPPGFRAEREARTLEVIDFAAAVGVRSFACHIGCVPEDRADGNYTAVRDMVRRICDHAASHGMNFALETGQEPAKVLLEFFEDVARPNLAVNFDPANMILYGSGDPIEALGILGPHVVSVHAKDGDWPNPAVAGSLGVERPLGSGAVGMERFVAKLREIGYKGTLNVEREGTSPEQWRGDVAAAVSLLNSLTQ